MGLLKRRIVARFNGIPGVRFATGVQVRWRALIHHARASALRGRKCSLSRGLVERHGGRNGSIQRLDWTRSNQPSKPAAGATHRGGHPGVLAANNEERGAAQIPGGERPLRLRVQTQNLHALSGGFSQSLRQRGDATEACELGGASCRTQGGRSERRRGVLAPHDAACRKADAAAEHRTEVLGILNPVEHDAEQRRILQQGRELSIDEIRRPGSYALVQDPTRKAVERRALYDLDGFDALIAREALNCGQTRVVAGLDDHAAQSLAVRADGGANGLQT